MIKHTLTLLITLLVTPLAALRAAETATATKPNIVFIYADDWGWGDLGSHGNTWQKTPNIDRLAREGLSFHQFNVLSPATFRPMRQTRPRSLQPLISCRRLAA